MLMEKERNEIVEFGKKMSSQGLSKGTSGNLSCYDPESGYMAIGPSGLGYFETTPEDVVVMDLEGNVIEGGRKPSSEHNLHATVYKHRPEARAVVHTHSTYCTTFACLRQPLKAVHYVISGAGVDEVPCAEYATFGTPELAASVGAAIGDSKAWWPAGPICPRHSPWPSIWSLWPKCSGAVWPWVRPPSSPGRR